jgi:hypothetical protein
VSATVPSGVKTQIATHDRFDKQCRPNRVEISVIAPPANGTVSTEPKDIVVNLTESESRTRGTTRLR